MVKGAWQQEWPRHLSTHTHIHLTHHNVCFRDPIRYTCQLCIPNTHMHAGPCIYICISAKKTHNKGSRTRPIMSTLMPRSGIPVICSRATLSCDSSYSETIAASDLKVSGSRHLIEYMKVCEYYMSRSFLDLGSRSCTYKNSNRILSETTVPI